MQNGYKLNGHTIEYIEVNQHDHYVYDDVFISTKLTEDVLIMFSQTGKVTYSNNHFINRFRCSRRGFHYGANKSEQEIGVFKRVYKDDAKRHRQGFEVDIERAIEVLSMTPEDVQDLPRGNALKHFVMQRTTVVNKYARQLKSLRRQMKRAKDKERYQTKIKEIQAKKMKLDSYIDERSKRANKRISNNKNTRFNRLDVIESFKALVIGAGSKPPEQYVN
jgi:hypothetical protein